jgi:hypothetical protein
MRHWSNETPRGSLPVLIATEGQMFGGKADTICQAIKEKRVLSFMYDLERRTLEPHVLGYDRDGELKLSGWQLSGGSCKGWRDFQAAKLTGLAITDAHFERPRSRWRRDRPREQTRLVETPFAHEFRMSVQSRKRPAPRAASRPAHRPPGPPSQARSQTSATRPLRRFRASPVPGGPS